MSLSVRTCPLCGEDNRATDDFCPSCGASLAAVRPRTILMPQSPTAFSLPDYLLGDAKRRRRRPTVEGAGGGMVTVGLVLVVVSLFTQIGPAPIWSTWAGGILLMVGGMVRMRFDRSAFNRLGLLSAGGSVLMLSVVGSQLTDMNVIGRRPDINPPKTPTPDWIEAGATTPQDGDADAAAATMRQLADVPIFRGDAARTGALPGPGPVGDPGLLWKLDTKGPVTSSPVIVGGVVYIGTKSGFLIAADAATGSERWRFDSGGAIIKASPVVSNGVVYLGASFNMFAIDAASGQERWKQPIEFAGSSSPVLVNGIVYVCSEQGTLYAFDAQSGDSKWKQEIEGLFFGSPAIADNSLYIGSDNGELYAYDATTGRLRWRFSTKGAIFASPVVSGPMVYISSKVGTLFAVDTATGRERWHYSAGGDSSPAVVNGVLYLGGDDGGVHAIDATTGKEKWLSATGTPIHSSPAVAGNTVYVGSGRTIYAFDITSGEQVWGYPTADSIESSPAVVNGVVYIGSGDGYLYAIGGKGPRNATPAA